MLRKLLFVVLLGFSAGLPAGVGHGGVVGGRQGEGAGGGHGGSAGGGQGGGAGGGHGGSAGGGRGVALGAVHTVGHGVGRGGVLGGDYGAASYAPAKYDFGYNVNAPQYGTNFGHSESRDGALTKGEYKVQLPDGRLQTVTYHVDNWGYHPVVSYAGQARFPARVNPLHGSVFGGVGGLGVVGSVAGVAGVAGVGSGRGGYN